MSSSFLLLLLSLILLVVVVVLTVGCCYTCYIVVVVGAKLSSEDKETIGITLDKHIKWLVKNYDADAEDFKSRKISLEEIIQPIIGKLY